MKIRKITANSQVGEYRGVTYGMEDNPPMRYYFRDKHGRTVYAEDEESIQIKIDGMLDRDITASTETYMQIQPGMTWDRNGHLFEVKNTSPDHKACKVTENWISEDTGKEIKRTYTYKIAKAENDAEYAYNPKYESYVTDPDTHDTFTLYATGADNIHKFI